VQQACTPLANAEEWQTPRGERSKIDEVGGEEASPSRRTRGQVRREEGGGGEESNSMGGGPAHALVHGEAEIDRQVVKVLI